METTETIKMVIPNDGMYTDEKEGWFVANRRAVLYKINWNNFQVELMKILPQKKEIEYRAYRYCLKRDKYVYCFPDREENIQVFDIDAGILQQIYINNPTQKRISIFNFWISDNKLWCVSYGLNQIIEIDLENNKVIAQYDMFEQSTEESGYEAIMVEHKIYCIARTSPRISVFDTEIYEKKELVLDVADQGFNTIYHDGKSFYLTGYAARIYMWDKKEIEQINLPSCYDLTSNGKSYECPIFYDSFFVKNGLFFIPWNNQGLLIGEILRLDIGSREYRRIVLDEGEQSRQSGEIFVVEYVMERKIGIYDVKQECIMEIDTEGELIKKRKMILCYDDELKQKILNERVVSENRAGDLNILICLCNS